MFRQVVFFQRGSNIGGGLATMFLTLGVSLVLLGLLILLYPQILVAMIASLFLLSGVFCLTVAWKERQFRRGF